MFRTLLAALVLALALTAQSASKITACTAHECHCRARTEAIQALVLTKCRESSKTDAELQRCVRATLPAHCAIADRMTEWDTDRQGDSEEGTYNRSNMGQLCMLACKKHRCACDDGPVCNYQMSEDEIREAEGQKPKHK